MNKGKKKWAFDAAHGVHRDRSGEMAFSLANGHFGAPVRKENAVFRLRTWHSALKRIGDVLVSLILLILLALPMILIAVWVRSDSAGPAIFRQVRVGRGEELFTVYKFRTMSVDTPRCSSAELSRLGRERYITGVGRILRRTGLDELPQLWNVLRGEMSLVGPRPVIPEETRLTLLRASLGASNLRPGITGLAQVSGRDDRATEEKAALDALYARTQSPLVDLRILWGTVRTVLSGAGCN